MKENENKIVPMVIKRTKAYKHPYCDYAENRELNQYETIKWCNLIDKPCWHSKELPCNQVYDLNIKDERIKASILVNNLANELIQSGINKPSELKKKILEKIKKNH